MPRVLHLAQRPLRNRDDLMVGMDPPNGSVGEPVNSMRFSAASARFLGRSTRSFGGICGWSLRLDRSVF